MTNIDAVLGRVIELVRSDPELHDAVVALIWAEARMKDTKAEYFRRRNGKLMGRERDG